MSNPFREIISIPGLPGIGITRAACQRALQSAGFAIHDAQRTAFARDLTGAEPGEVHPDASAICAAIALGDMQEAARLISGGTQSGGDASLYTRKRNAAMRAALAEAITEGE